MHYLNTKKLKGNPLLSFPAIAKYEHQSTWGQLFKFLLHIFDDGVNCPLKEATLFSHFNQILKIDSEFPRFHFLQRATSPSLPFFYYDHHLLESYLLSINIVQCNALRTEFFFLLPPTPNFHSCQFTPVSPPSWNVWLLAKPMSYPNRKYVCNWHLVIHINRRGVRTTREPIAIIWYRLFALLN